MKTRWKVIGGMCGVCLVLYCLILPARLFDVPYSTVIEARDGKLLAAAIAADGQWRFPSPDSLPAKYITSLLAFEDHRFYSHPGIDPLALGRAIRQNINEGRVVSGASTITMQVVRLSRNARRNIISKFYEMILATRLEFRYTKHEILNLYAAHAPFGGNVIGIDAACWRYFGTDPSQLSWSQAALLAVLPNAPSMIHPGKNRLLLKQKRNRLLDTLHRLGKIDALTCELAKDEPLPDAPHPIPRQARHVLTTFQNRKDHGRRIRSTIDAELQSRVQQLVNEHYNTLKLNLIHNAAAIVLDVNTGDVLAYAGNVTSESRFENDVDNIQALRSTGSILKPILYAAMQDHGKILPGSLLPDVPMFLGDFSPKNYSLQYDGVVKANHALIRSLNVPAVDMLKNFRYERFHALLGDMGITSLKQPPDHYGLSLILGGAEGSLWEVAGLYGSMARTLNNYFKYAGSLRYRSGDFHPPVFERHDVSDSLRVRDTWLSAASISITFDVLTDLYRPAEEAGWKHFSSSQKIAWKTGTSFGLRDGWAIGVTPQYVVGVWVGNSDGEGRPGLTGTDAAAPLMFNIFSQLPSGGWFQKPFSEMEKIPVCSESGYRMSVHCPTADSLWVVKAGLGAPVCSHHKRIHLSADGTARVHESCEDLGNMSHQSWFVLPPTQEYYFKRANRSYKPLPPFRDDCTGDRNMTAMDMVYPKQHATVYLPKLLDGTLSTPVFQVAHRNPAARLYWHLDGKFLTTTLKDHKLPIGVPAGKHTLTVLDDDGELLERNFTVQVSQ